MNSEFFFLCTDDINTFYIEKEKKKKLTSHWAQLYKLHNINVVIRDCDYDYELKKTRVIWFECCFIYVLYTEM